MTEISSVKTAELAAIFADSEGRLKRLVATGTIKELSRGRVGLVEAVRAFLDDLRAEVAENSATRAGEAARSARADAAQLRLAERRREVIPVEDAEAAIDFMAGEVNSSLIVLPARVTRDVRDRRKLDELVFALRARIASAVGGAEQ